MTSIDPRLPPAAALHKQAARLRQRASLQRDASATASQSAAQLMAQRLRAIAGDDPQRHSKAARIYLETELARALGEQVVNDPAFAQMVDAVQAQMQQDAETAAALESAGQWLLAQPPSA